MDRAQNGPGALDQRERIGHLSGMPPRRRWLWLSGYTVLLFLSVRYNLFGVAEPEFFAQTAVDSEWLVAGRMVVDIYDKERPARTNLVFASVREFEISQRYVPQALALVNRSPLPERTLALAPLEQPGWAGGLSLQAGAVAVSRDETLGAYVGRRIGFDGQQRIINSVAHDGPLTHVFVTGSWPPQDPLATIRLSGATVDPADIVMTPYGSQFGAQGAMFAALNRWTGAGLQPLRTVVALLLALTASGLSILYGRLLPARFGGIFAVTLLLSPWMTALGRNLYWVPFSWFVPALCGAVYALAHRRTHRAVTLGILFLSVTLKCLAGYEYLSSILLLAAVPQMYNAISGRRPWRQELAALTTLCSVTVAGFVVALLIHGATVGETAWSGAWHILLWVGRKRTYGDPSLFPPGPAASLAANPIDVLMMYLLKWRTDILPFVPGTLFPWLCAIAVGWVGLSWARRKAEWRSDLALLVACALPALSWYLLAKAHSAEHPHLNFVLWYFGFVAALFFLCGKAAWQLVPLLHVGRGR
jgi:hypothetical protein